MRSASSLRPSVAPKRSRHGLFRRHTNAAQDQVNVIGVYLFKGEAIRRSTKMWAKLFDGVGRGSLRRRCQFADHHIFDHSPAIHSLMRIPVSWIVCLATSISLTGDLPRNWELPRQRFSRVPGMLSSLEVKNPSCNLMEVKHTSEVHGRIPPPGGV
jgi:hypothetical protein